MTPIERMAGRLGNRMFQFAYIWAQCKRGAVPDVWLQDPKYFDEFRAEIQQMYGGGIRTRKGLVSMHVRRTDYLTEAAFVNLAETDYYERAMALFPGQEIVIFSDDPDWCRRRWRHIAVHPKGSEIDDMNEMASCEHNIIANSSYSWWAGYLNPNPNKIVVYPKRWFTIEGPRIACPREWQCL